MAAAIASAFAAGLCPGMIMRAPADETEPPGDERRSSVEVRAIQIEGRRYCYVDEGVGPTVVLVHGAIVAEGVWDKQIPPLVRAGYRVICPHRAGMGGSDPTEAASVAKDVDDIWALLDSLGVKKCVVGGHSAGASHVFQMLLGRPEAIEGVVLADAGYSLLPGAQRLGPERATPQALAFYEKHKDELKRLGLPWIYASDFNMKMYREWDKLKSDQELMKRAARHPDPRDLARPEGKFCRVPLLAVAAGWGKIKQDDPEAVALAELLPADDAAFHVFVECGHWVQQEPADAFNRALLGFLDEKLRGKSSAMGPENSENLKELKRLVFLSHPYAWELQFLANPERAKTFEWGGFNAAELVAMERRISSLWPEEIGKLGADAALIINYFGARPPDADLGKEPTAPLLRAADEHLGDRHLVLFGTQPQNRFGEEIRQKLRERGYTYDPYTVATESWGQSTEGCVADYSAHFAAGMGLPMGFPIRYEMTFPDAPFAMTGAFLERVAIGDTDVSAYLFESKDGGPFAICFPGALRDGESTRCVELTIDPARVEFTNKKGEPVAVARESGRFRVPLHVDRYGAPIYIWGKGVKAAELRAALASADVSPTPADASRRVYSPPRK
jgi:pimeloyl-ACP methyl ester carboxylesterase